MRANWENVDGADDRFGTGGADAGIDMDIEDDRDDVSGGDDFRCFRLRRYMARSS